jgi:MFS family permease
MGTAQNMSERRFGLIFSGVLPLFMLAHFMHHLVTAVPGPLLPMIRSEFGLDYSQSGLVLSAFTLAYGLAQVPSGWLADRINPRVLMISGVCGVAVAGLLVGLSREYTLLLVLLALMGLLGGGYHPSAPPIISALVEPRHLGRALGLHLAGGGASFFAAPILAAGIAAILGWRGVFVGLAIPTLLFGVLFSLYLRKWERKPREDGRTGGEEASGSPGTTQVRRLVAFILLSTCTGAILISVISFIPLYLVDRFHVDEKAAGAFLGIIYSGGLWVGPVAGHISDRVGRVPMLVGACFLSGLTVYFLGLVPYGWPFSLLLFLMGVIIFVRMPVSESFIIGETASRHRSTVLGLYFFGAMEGGGILTFFMGRLIDHVGFRASFAIASGCLLLVTLACSVALRATRAR